MVTIKDIAAQMNLHFTTVAKALRDHPDISATTKEKVQAVADKLNYHPNRIASSFKKQKSNTVGIIVPEINYDFSASLISGVENVIYDAGYSLIICQSNDSVELEALHTKKFIENQVEGIIIQVTGGDDEYAHLETLQRHGIKVVLIDRTLKNFNSTAVVVDDYNGSIDIMEHLIESGYKKIAHFGGPEHLSVAISRRKGYQDILKKYGIAIDEEMIIHGGFYETDGEQSMKKLLAIDKIPDAIFCANDAIATGVYLALNTAGLKIPQDVAVAGFGNLGFSRFLNPPLTTVNQFPLDLGRQAAESLLSLINSRGSNIVENIEMLKTELIIRQST